MKYAHPKDEVVSIICRCARKRGFVGGASDVGSSDALAQRLPVTVQGGGQRERWRGEGEKSAEGWGVVILILSNSMVG